MRKLHFTDPELKNFALRGLNSIRGGMKLLHISNNPVYRYAERVDSLTAAYELPQHVLVYMSGRVHSNDKTMKAVYFYQDERGKITHRYLTDSGVIPYISPQGSMLNNTNILIDLDVVRNAGIEVEY